FTSRQRMDRMSATPERSAPDDLALAVVAARLGRSIRWLQNRLADDARKPLSEQKLQLHHYVGRSPRWTESEDQALRAAIIAEDTAKRRPGCASSSGTGSGISTALSGSADVQSAYDAVLAFPQQRKTSKQPKRSGSTRSGRCETKSPLGSSRPLPW